MAEHHHVVIEVATGRAVIESHEHRMNGGPHEHADTANARVTSESFSTKREAHEVLVRFNQRPRVARRRSA